MSALDIILKNPLLLISVVLSVLILLTSGIALLLGLAHMLMVEQPSKRIPFTEITLLSEGDTEPLEDLDDTVPMLPITWIEDHTKPSAPVTQEKAYV